jgi:hypothetical protein
MTLSEIKHILAERRIQLTRSLGQSFLHDGNQLRRIVAAAELTKADKVLEVGPGLGPLTELLLGHAGEVLAIEKDARLVEVLGKRFAGARNVMPFGWHPRRHDHRRCQARADSKTSCNTGASPCSISGAGTAEFSPAGRYTCGSATR